MLQRPQVLGFALGLGAAAGSLLIAGAAISTGAWLWLGWACAVLLVGVALSRLVPFVMERQVGAIEHLRPHAHAHGSVAAGAIEIRRPGGDRADRQRAFVVVVDGNPSASLKPGESVRLEVAPGAHVVRCHIDWGSSRAVEVRLASEDEVWLACRSQAIPLALICLLFRPTRYLRLVTALR